MCAGGSVGDDVRMSVDEAGGEAGGIVGDGRLVAGGRVDVTVLVTVHAGDVGFGCDVLAAIRTGPRLAPIPITACVIALTVCVPVRVRNGRRVDVADGTVPTAWKMGLIAEFQRALQKEAVAGAGSAALETPCAAICGAPWDDPESSGPSGESPGD